MYAALFLVNKAFDSYTRRLDGRDRAFLSFSMGGY